MIMLFLQNTTVNILNISMGVTERNQFLIISLQSAGNKQWGWDLTHLGQECDTVLIVCF